MTLATVVILFLIVCASLLSTNSFGKSSPDFALLARACAPQIHNQTIRALVSVESDFNPYAIGVVDGRLSRQPNNLAEALEVVRELDKQGMNYSLGIAQVNKYNLAKHGLSPTLAFDPCKNLTAGSKILLDCYNRAKESGLEGQPAVRAALSCYYSGNFTTGFKDGYVQEVVARATEPESSKTIKIIKTRRTKRKTENKKTRVITPTEDKRERDPAFVF
ncbi:MAG: Type IV secretion system protein virB1 [Syntrophorhabdus sp. PtaU1.Bin153]|nr:MAG: Type IV secretion system protein virB1 [Syntrophorhabdus sp. PtaU1.Bin153]